MPSLTSVRNVQPCFSVKIGFSVFIRRISLLYVQNKIVPCNQYLSNVHFQICIRLEKQIIKIARNGSVKISPRVSSAANILSCVYMCVCACVYMRMCVRLYRRMRSIRTPVLQ